MSRVMANHFIAMEQYVILTLMDREYVTMTLLRLKLNPGISDDSVTVTLERIHWSSR